MSRFDLQRVPRVVVWLGFALALGSLGVGVFNSLQSSIDFQWSPTRLLWSGTNPYEYQLRPERPLIILQQNPAYGHLLYLLLWPYAQLDWYAAKLAWMLTNVALLAAGLWLLWRTLEARQARQLFVFAVLLLCIGFTVRNLFANGQQTLLMFFAMVVFLLYRERPLLAGLALAVLLTKYTFGLQILLLAVVLGYYRAAALALAVTAASVVAFGALSGASGVELLTGPLSVARTMLNIGFGDLFSLGRRLSGGGRDSFTSLPLVALSAGINLAFFAAIWLRLRNRPRPDFHQVALLLAATLYVSMGTIYHLKYDYMTLIVCLYAIVLAAAMSARAFVGLVVAHFVVYWLVPRHENLFALGPAGDALVIAMILSFLALAGFCLRAAFTGRQGAQAASAAALA